MDARFSGNPLSNRNEGGYGTDTVLRLDSTGSLNCSSSNQKGVKRKWSLRDGSGMDMESELPLCLWVGNTSSSSDSKASSATGCTTISSHKETDEECSMDLDLDFSLHLGGEKTPFRKKDSSFNSFRLDLEHQDGLELSLSSTFAESDISTVQTNCFSSISSVTCLSGQHGGRRCSYGSCTSAARGRSGLCIRHGGGKRCQLANCTKSAEGLSGVCISHGGGRMCQFLGCTKGAQGSTMLCKAHGGGKRCMFDGCNKGAEGSTPYCKAHGGGKRCAFESDGVCPKSVHGGTLYCVAHGGGKRCVVPDCTRSARGRTDCCVRHGGGKRCKTEGCGKSAQGSTDFCKAHGGGTRCTWGYLGSEYGKSDEMCNFFARGKNGLCAYHGAMVQDNRVHGGSNLGSLVHDSTEDMNIDTNVMGLLPFSGFGWKPFGVQQVSPAGPGPSMVSGGRVHGGSLIALLAGNSNVSSDTGKVNMMAQKWI
ncbi:uncharacterized protein [Rutidosis leptorrhynchoides]|uniref:uncharacterized protein n=1 Tax=Rutidosis leptorrhynchoides TaxID=125765 RepID=UPI003A9A26D9